MSKYKKKTKVWQKCEIIRQIHKHKNKKRVNEVWRNVVVLFLYNPYRASVVSRRNSIFYIDKTIAHCECVWHIVAKYIILKFAGGRYIDRDIWDIYMELIERFGYIIFVVVVEIDN